MGEHHPKNTAALVFLGKLIFHGLYRWGLIKENVFIYPVGAVRETKKSAVQNTRQRTKIFAAHCTKCSPRESKVVCHAVLARSLPTARTEINLHHCLKGRNLQGFHNTSWNLSVTKTHPPLLSRWSMQGPCCIQEPRLSWLYLHNICQHMLTFRHLSVTWIIVL